LPLLAERVVGGGCWPRLTYPVCGPLRERRKDRGGKERCACWALMLRGGSYGILVTGKKKQRACGQGDTLLSEMYKEEEDEGPLITIQFTDQITQVGTSTVEEWTMYLGVKNPRGGGKEKTICARRPKLPTSIAKKHITDGETTSFAGEREKGVKRKRGGRVRWTSLGPEVGGKKERHWSL